MTATMSRRALVSAAWTVPTMTIVTAAPALATSLTGPSRLSFTNTTATEGKKKRRLYVNTRLQVLDGPEPVTGITLTISVTGQESKTWSWDSLPGWGNTDQIYAEWDLPGKKLPQKVTVTFSATADGMEPLTATRTFTPPSWWSR